MALVTSLNKIREYRPCTSGWKTLLKALGKTEPDDEPITIEFILNSNGVDDAIWCLRATTGHTDAIIKFAQQCADAVAHLKNSSSSAAQRYAADAANAVYAVYAANAANAAAAYAVYAADAYAVYAAAAAAARKKCRANQAKLLLAICKECEES